MITLPSGDLVVGGVFTRAFGSQLNTIFRWDGSNAQPMGPAGLNGGVWVLKLLPNGNVLIGGDFTDAGGDATADHLALWNGAAYHSVGGGLNDRVSDAAITPSGDLVVVGRFTDAGGNPHADRLALWNGTTWQSLGTGLNDAALCVSLRPNNDIVVGGLFTASGDGSVPMHHFGIYRANPNGLPEPVAPTLPAWPNPAQTVVQVPVSSTTHSIHLLDATGRIVQRQSVGSGSTTATLTVADLPRGLYWLQTGKGAGQRLILD